MTSSNTINLCGMAIALTAIGSLALATSAYARPGTPDDVRSWSSYPGNITVRWQNTANEGGVVFDIEGRGDPSVANWSPPGGVQMHSRISYTFNHLSAGQHCFRVWSRVGAQGERSELPSAFTCATTSSLPMSPSHQPPSHPCAGLVCSAGSLTP